MKSLILDDTMNKTAIHSSLWTGMSSIFDKIKGLIIYNIIQLINVIIIFNE
jgi:hypothetical protein